MSVRTCASRLARIEKTVAARCPAGPDRPILVEVAVDEAGVGRLRSVAGPYRGCVCCGWPEDAYEPFAGNRAELHDYYARHGWQPDRTLLLFPHGGETLFYAEAGEPPRT